MHMCAGPRTPLPPMLRTYYVHSPKGKSNQGFSKSETTKIELVIGPAAAVALVMSAPLEGERWKLSCKRRRM